MWSTSFDCLERVQTSNFLGSSISDNLIQLVKTSGCRDKSSVAHELRVVLENGWPEWTAAGDLQPLLHRICSGVVDYSVVRWLRSAEENIHLCTAFIHHVWLDPHRCLLLTCVLSWYIYFSFYLKVSKHKLKDFCFRIWGNENGGQAVVWKHTDCNMLLMCRVANCHTFIRRLSNWFLL